MTLPPRLEQRDNKELSLPAEPAFAAEIAKDRADWLLDAVACSTQDRRFLRGDPEYDEVAGEAILRNGEKAILVAIAKATSQGDS